MDEAVSCTRMMLFDLDGTLVDSAPDIARCVDMALAELALPARGTERIKSFIGNGAARLIHRALTDDLDGTAAPADFEAAYASYMQHYANGMNEQSRVYPGVIETLEALRKRSWRMACVTNKPGRFTEPMLRHFALLAFFDYVQAGDTLEVRKPDPAPLLHVATGAGVPLARCVMVGDTLTDVAAARAAGMPVVCVAYGYGVTADLRRARPQALVEDLREILPLVDGGVLAEAPRARRPATTG